MDVVLANMCHKGNVIGPIMAISLTLKIRDVIHIYLIVYAALKSRKLTSKKYAFNVRLVYCTHHIISKFFRSTVPSIFLPRKRPY